MKKGGSMSIDPVTSKMLKAGDDYVNTLELITNRYINACPLYKLQAQNYGTSSSKCGSGPLKDIR